MLLLIDNFDSFTYNIVQAFQTLGQEIAVLRNEKKPRGLNPLALIIGPGPGRPQTAGMSLDYIRAYAGKIPILGICLGHQAIGEVFGASTIRAPIPMHGKNSLISHMQRGLFQGLPNPFSVTRYHSLIIDPSTVPSDLEITAQTADGVIMGISHRTLPIHGLQFHPESIGTPDGHLLLKNFLKNSFVRNEMPNCNRSHRPNEKTMKALKEEGEIFDTISDFGESMGITPNAEDKSQQQIQEGSQHSQSETSLE